MSKTTLYMRVNEGVADGIPFVRVDGLEHFNVAQIFDCGQAFRFLPVPAPDGSFAVGGVAYGKYVEFSQSGDMLTIRNSTREEYEKIWKHYLSLDVDYNEIQRDLKARFDSEVFEKAVEVGDGIRLLRQEPWECVCSFIISQNNNIPRIRKIIESLSEKYGDEIEFDGKKYYAFPTPETLVEAGIDEIFALRTGFRAKYIYDAARMVAEGELDLARLFELDTDGALSELCRVKGIGPKVASCALLFAFEKYEAFPVDVWVKKILEKYFPDGLDIKSLGDYAGIAQQYLFFYERYIVAGK